MHCMQCFINPGQLSPRYPLKEIPEEWSMHSDQFQSLYLISPTCLRLESSSFIFLLLIWAAILLLFIFPAWVLYPTIKSPYISKLRAGFFVTNCTLAIKSNMSEKFWQLSHGDGIFKQLLTAGQSIPMKLSGKKTKFSGNIFRELVSPRCCISCKIPIWFAGKAFPEGQIIGNPTICIVTPKFAWPYFVVAYILFAFILQMQLLRYIYDKKETTMVIASLDNISW